MILKKRYDEIMDYIEVTEQMRSRILNNIQQADVSAPQNNIIHFSNIRKYLPIAACFVLLLVCTLTITHYLAPDSPDDPIVLAPGSDIVNVLSIEELADTVGFEVENLSGIPFNVEHTEYTAYWQELAQVSYTGDDKTLIYRKSLGEEDNSGDYTNYENHLDIEVGRASVQLKGNGENFNLAIWKSRWVFLFHTSGKWHE